MKHSISLILLFTSFYSFAYKNDSTEIKLKQYKDMFSNGLINETEYSKLKQILLFPYSLKTDSEANYVELKQRYLGQIIGGTVIFIGGTAVIGVGIHYKKNKFPDITKYYSNGRFNSSEFDGAIKNYRSKYITSIALGSTFAGVGLVLEILGIHNKTIYLNKSKNIGLGLSNNGIGAALSFK